VSDLREDINPLRRVLEWSRLRPIWQRDALRRLLTQNAISEDDIEELAQLCLKGFGDKSVTISGVPLESHHIPSNPGQGESIRIKEISHVKGVNQIAENQTLKFEPDGITVIYGRNGTGKSGYTRILKRASKSRYAGKIMPDINRPTEGGLASTKFQLLRSNGSVEEIDWVDDNEDYSPLTALTVFDRDSGKVHLQQENDVLFRPFGLDVPDELVSIFKRVNARLKHKSYDVPDTDYKASARINWDSRSDIGKFIDNLKPTSDLKYLDSFTPLSQQEEILLAKLQRDLAGPPKAISQKYQAEALGLRQMLSNLTRISRLFSQEKISKLVEKYDEMVLAREAANVASTLAFSDLNLENVGLPIWKSLWDSARRYSDSLAKPSQSFPPNENEVCVLCHQKIDHDTHIRMNRFQKYINDDTESFTSRGFSNFR